jgi:hypothetical protein
LTTELTMPQMGYDMQEGAVVRWLKAEGSNVEIRRAKTCLIAPRRAFLVHRSIRAVRSPYQTWA